MEDVQFRYVCFLRAVVEEEATTALPLTLRATRRAPPASRAAHGADAVVAGAAAPHVFPTGMLVHAAEHALRPVHEQFLALCAVARGGEEAQAAHFARLFPVAGAHRSADAGVAVGVFFSRDVVPLTVLVFDGGWPVVDADELARVAQLLGQCDTAPFHCCRGCLKTYAPLPSVGGILVDTAGAPDDAVVRAVNAAFAAIRGGRPGGLLARKIADSLQALIAESPDAELQARCAEALGGDAFADELLCAVLAATFGQK